MNRFAKTVLASTTVVVIAAALASCGSSTAGDASPKNGGASAKVVTPAPSKSATVAPKPFNASGWLAGNANPMFPDGEAGKVSVVSEGALKEDGSGSATLPIAYRNNTDKPISHVDVSGAARVNGTLSASGSSQGAIPAQIEPGEIGLAFIYFEDSKSLPKDGAGITYTYTFDTIEADTSSYNTAPLKVGEATANGKSIVGSADNTTGKPLTGPYDVNIYCFAQNKITDRTQTFADQDNDIKADAQVTFTADLYNTKCDNFTVGVSGYFQ